MVADLLYHEAQHMAEDLETKKHKLPSGKPVNPLWNGIKSAAVDIVKAMPMYISFGVAAALVTGFVLPGFGIGQTTAPFSLELLKDVFGFANGSFSAAGMEASLVSLPLIGGAIKGIMGFVEGKKEAEKHNDKLAGRAPSKAKGRGRDKEINEGLAVTGAVLGDKETPSTPANDRSYATANDAWHPADDQRGSFAERVGGARTSNAQSLAERVEAERSSRLGQADQLGA